MLSAMVPGGTVMSMVSHRSRYKKLARERHILRVSNSNLSEIWRSMERQQVSIEAKTTMQTVINLFLTIMEQVFILGISVEAGTYFAVVVMTVAVDGHREASK